MAGARGRDGPASRLGKRPAQCETAPVTAGVPTGVDETYRGFLFADLRGYTADVERHGDRAASALLDTYRALVRGQVAAHAGAEIKTEGDSFYVVFGTARRAVQCALDIVAAADEYNGPKPAFPIRVGVGVHAGEVVEGSEGYVGSAVNLAARVCSIAGPGEVLVSSTVRELTRTGQRVEYVARGTHRFKGVGEPVAVFAARPLSADGRRHAHTRRSSGIPSRRSLGAIGLALTVGVLAFSGAILFGNQLLGIGGAAEPRQTAATSADVASGPGSPVATATVQAAFPNEAEAHLLAQIEANVARSCDRADPANAPQMYRYQDFLREVRVRFPMPTVAGLSCLLVIDDEPDLVEVWEAVSLRSVDEAFFAQAGEAGLQAGDCETDERAHGTWEFGQSSGRLLCIASSSDARITWTYADMPIIATAIREDSDGQLLYGWWRDHARSLRPVDD